MLNAQCVECHDFHTPEEAGMCLFGYLEVFSNWQRLHSSLGYRSPLGLEQLPVVTWCFHPCTTSRQPHLV
jgi:hypothetical protein